MHTIVVDDGSEPPIGIERAEPRLNLCLLRLERHAGIVAALNRGLEQARHFGARYVARLDAGDTVAPERLARQLGCLEADPGVGIVASDALFVDESGAALFRFEAPRTDAEVRRRMHVNSCLPHPTVMLRMSVLERTGFYSTAFPAAEDYELFSRVLACSRAACIPEALTTKSVSRSGISASRRREQLRSRLRVQARYFDWGAAASYYGLALTLLLFLVPARLLAAMKRRAGAVRY